MVSQSASGGGKGGGTLRDRARAFAFEGLPDTDRFGVFDPALRAGFILAVMLAAVFAAGGLLDALGKTGASLSAAGLIVAGAAAAGLYGYRRVWPTESERELLLRMAREDDESRALRAKLAATPEGRRKRP